MPLPLSRTCTRHDSKLGDAVDCGGTAAISGPAGRPVGIQSVRLVQGAAALEDLVSLPSALS